MRSLVADLLGDAAIAFDDAQVDWYLFGAQAAILHGAARLTADVDITVRLSQGLDAEGLAGALTRHGFHLRIAGPAFVTRTSVLPFLHGATSLPLDVVLAGPGLEDRFFSRVETRDVEGVRVRVASAEDVVVMKTLAGRAKDADDVKAILSASAAGLDVSYIREMLTLLEDALGQSDLAPAFEQALARSHRNRE